MYEYLKHLLDSSIPWGTGIILWVQSRRTPWLNILFMIASLDKRGALFALFPPLVYWSINRSLGIELIYLNILAQFITALLKSVFAIARPDVAVLMPGGMMPESFSFPSGHAQVSVTIFGYLALRTRHRWLRLLWLSFIPLISFSRIYMGVHYPQDVIGGILIGLFLIGLFYLFYHPIEAWLKERSVITLVVISLLATPFLLSVQFLFTQPNTSSPPALLPSALLTGASLGLIAETRYLNFSVEGTLIKRALRFISGLLLVSAIFILTEIAKLSLMPYPPPNYVLEWLQYALVGCGLTFGAPWFFTKLGLQAHMTERERIDTG